MICDPLSPYHRCLPDPAVGVLGVSPAAASATAGKLPVSLLPSPDVMLSVPIRDSAAMATRFFLGVAAASPDAAWGEGGTRTDPGDAFASLLGTGSVLWDAFAALLGAVPVPRGV